MNVEHLGGVGDGEQWQSFAEELWQLIELNAGELDQLGSISPLQWSRLENDGQETVVQFTLGLGSSGGWWWWCWSGWASSWARGGWWWWSRSGAWCWDNGLGCWAAEGVAASSDSVTLVVGNVVHRVFTPLVIFVTEIERLRNVLLNLSSLTSPVEFNRCHRYLYEPVTASPAVPT